MHTDVDVQYQLSSGLNQTINKPITGQQGYIFPDLNLQETVFEFALGPKCFFQNFMCGGEACSTYPLAFKNGSNTCYLDIPTPDIGPEIS